MDPSANFKLKRVYVNPMLMATKSKSKKTTLSRDEELTIKPARSNLIYQNMRNSTGMSLKKKSNESSVISRETQFISDFLRDRESINVVMRNEVMQNKSSLNIQSNAID